MSKKLTALWLFFALSPTSLFAQVKHDYVWAHGLGNVSVHLGYTFGGMLIDFNTEPLTIHLDGTVLSDPFASISDRQGNLVASTDGCKIANRGNELMLNGDSLNPGKVFNTYCGASLFYPIMQPCTFLPMPGSDSLYYLFHLRGDDRYRLPMSLLYSVLDASGAGGDGAVLHKNALVFSDSIMLGHYLTAVRHANGRDWWLAVTRLFNSEIHLSLLTPDTVQYMGMKDVGFVEVDSGACCHQSRFSPDGSKFFRNHPGGLLTLDFDRCDGTFSNPVYWDYDTVPNGTGGVAISPDNRFLYLCSGLTVQQYDLQADDVLASREVVAEYDGFVQLSPTTFFLAQLGPDGKIYVLTNSNNNVWHIIHYPNRKGLACKVEQRGLQLPAQGSYFPPNNPNYRLGPIDGYSCDTLGIDNLPVALFRYDVEDTLSPLEVTFTDLSYYEPDNWHWDFGDGIQSQEQAPLHAYALPGSYTACLTASNANASDTYCRQVVVSGSSGIKSLPALPLAQVAPNPFTDVLRVQLPALVGVSPRFVLYDLLGREVHAAWLRDFDNDLQLSQLPPGMYVWQLRWNGEVAQSGRVVKQ